MIFAILSLNTVIRQSFRESQDIGEVVSLISVGNRFRNIERAITGLDKQGVAQAVDERILPFNYDLNGDLNYLTIEQRLPLRDEQFNEFFDIINMFEMFLEDQNREHFFDGIAADVNTLKNSNWGGSDDTLHFLVEPFCYGYTVNPNTMLFGGSTSEKCEGSFQDSYMRRFDLNLTVANVDEDFDEILCNNGNCPQDPFNPGDDNPYYRVEIDDRSCGNCDLSQTIASEHFDPADDFNVVISCSSGECNSSTVIFSGSGTDLNLYHESSYRLNVDAKTTFSREIENFYFLDFNITVTHFGTNASKSNNPNAFD